MKYIFMPPATTVLLLLLVALSNNCCQLHLLLLLRMLLRMHDLVGCALGTHENRADNNWMIERCFLDCPGSPSADILRQCRRARAPLCALCDPVLWWWPTCFCDRYAIGLNRLFCSWCWCFKLTRKDNSKWMVMQRSTKERKEFTGGGGGWSSSYAFNCKASNQLSSGQAL